MKRTLFIASLLGYFNCFYAQEIDAPEISNWNNPKKLDPNYTYNSAYVYLVNGPQLAGLFSGETLTPQERRKSKLKEADYPKYLFLSLKIPNPQKDNEVFTLPLYMIDATNKKNVLLSAPSEGMVLDEIKDRDLGYKPLIATGQLVAIKGNSDLEIVSQSLSIAKELFKTAAAITSSPFGIGNVTTAISNGANYFDKVASDKKVTNEFKIPIIPLSQFHKYQLTSVTVHQIKWSFRPPNSDLLAGINGQEKTIDEIKGLLPQDGPYLIVARFKSQYELPQDWIKGVVVDQSYLDARNGKVMELIGMKRELEIKFLENLKLAIAIKQDYQVFKTSQENNQFNLEALTKIMDSYFQIKSNEHEEAMKLLNDKGRADYFNDSYYTAYSSMFTILEPYLSKDIQNARDVVDAYLDVCEKKISTLSVEEITSSITKLSFYREAVQKYNNENKSILQIAASPFYQKYDNLMKDLEVTLFEKTMGFLTAKLSTEEKIQKLKDLIATYSTFPIYKALATKSINDLENSTIASKRVILNTMKSSCITNVQCWSDVSKLAMANFSRKFPTESISGLEGMEEGLYKKCEKSYQNLVSAGNAYIDMVDLNFEGMTPAQVNDALIKYSILKETIVGAIIILKDAHILEDSELCKFDDGAKK